MPESRRCPQCGTPVRPDAPEGLCPECLLKEAMKSGSEPAHEHGVTTTHGPGPGDFLMEGSAGRTKGCVAALG